MTLLHEAPKYLLRFSLIFIFYLAFSKLGSLMVMPPGQASIIWPAAGIALGTLYVYGLRYFPTIFLAAATNSLSHYETIDQQALTIASIIALGATLQAIIGQIVLKNLYARKAPLGNLKKIFSFLFLVGPSPCLISTSIATITLTELGGLENDLFWTHLISWGLGDLFGVILITPLVVISLQRLIQGRVVEFKTRMTVVIPVSISLVVFSFVFNALKHETMERVHSDFDLIAASKVNSLEEAIFLDITAIKSIAAYFDSSNYVTAEEFTRYADTILRSIVGAYSVSYLPKVINAERDIFLKSMHEQGFNNFQIKKRGETEELIASTKQEVYFPITYIEPFEENTEIHG